MSERAPTKVEIDSFAEIRNSAISILSANLLIVLRFKGASDDARNINTAVNMIFNAMNPATNFAEMLAFLGELKRGSIKWDVYGTPDYTKLAYLWDGYWVKLQMVKSDEIDRIDKESERKDRKRRLRDAITYEEYLKQIDNGNERMAQSK